MRPEFWPPYDYTNLLPTLTQFQGSFGHRSGAVANGMSYEVALRAITINPATIFGVADRSGSLEAGKDADVVIWSGDPFEPLSQPSAVFVRGQQQTMTTRATELRDRYRNLNTAYPPAYTK